MRRDRKRRHRIRRDFPARFAELVLWQEILRMRPRRFSDCDIPAGQRVRLEMWRRFRLAAHTPICIADAEFSVRMRRPVRIRFLPRWLWCRALRNASEIDARESQVPEKLRGEVFLLN